MKTLCFLLYATGSVKKKEELNKCDDDELSSDLHYNLFLNLGLLKKEQNLLLHIYSQQNKVVILLKSFSAYDLVRSKFQNKERM